MFFVVSSLGEIDPMYQFSLQYFTNVFNATISQAKPSDNFKKRMNILLVRLSRFQHELLAKLVVLLL